MLAVDKFPFADKELAFPYFYRWQEIFPPLVQKDEGERVACQPVKSESYTTTTVTSNHPLNPQQSISCGFLHEKKEGDTFNREGTSCLLEKKYNIFIDFDAYRVFNITNGSVDVSVFDILERSSVLADLRGCIEYMLKLSLRLHLLFFKLSVTIALQYFLTLNTVTKNYAIQYEEVLPTYR